MWLWENYKGWIIGIGAVLAIIFPSYWILKVFGHDIARWIDTPKDQRASPYNASLWAALAGGDINAAADALLRGADPDKPISNEHTGAVSLGETCRSYAERTGRGRDLLEAIALAERKRLGRNL